MLIQSQVQVPTTNTLFNTAVDCLHFVTEFFEVISQSAPHIYRSALQLAPQSSIVWKLYSQQFHSPLARVVTGTPASWDLCTASTGTQEIIHHATWSPCGQFIAAGSGSSVLVRDSNTLEMSEFVRFHLLIFTSSCRSPFSHTHSFCHISPFLFFHDHPILSKDN